MEIAEVRDLLIIILFSLLSILIIGGIIAGFIIYRKVNRTVQKTVETVKRPIRSAERMLAFVTGGAKGVGEAFNIMVGREVKHEHPIHRH